MDADPVPLHRLTRAPRGRRAPLHLPALVVLLGLALRILTLGIGARFHPDEALFAAQARLISHDGDWLLRTTDLDKPPLTLYVTALSFRLLGPTEFAARLPTILFSGLSVALVYCLAQALYRDRAVSALAALLCALSPYLLAFAPTAFTDGQATFWVLLAALLAARDRWGWAGSATALAFAAKTTALWAVPLIVALGLARSARPAWRERDVLARLARYALPLLAGAALLALWDLGRAPRSFFSLGYARNNPGRLIRSDELWPRLEAWAHWLSFATGSPALNALLAALVPAWLVARLVKPLSTSSSSALSVSLRFKRTPPTRFMSRQALRLAYSLERLLSLPHPRSALTRLAAPSPLTERGQAERSEAGGEVNRALDWIIVAYGIALLGGLWLIAFNTYDRYLHTLVPFALLLAARALIGAIRRISARPALPLALGAALVAAMLPGTLAALRGDAPLGGDQGAHNGIDALADFLNAELPGEIVYDHWLGWELAFYLGATPRVSVVYQPRPAALAEEMSGCDCRRTFVAPQSPQVAPWLAALARAGVAVTPIYGDAAGCFAVYRLDAPAQH
ncbi:MAG: glycosyltransferase family 39 protein [Anaerolineae bacterium]|nr:glycosyltransferase family 39 protein [Anaerolineae bacterium]